MTDQRLRFATVPVAIEHPDSMLADIQDVLGGEYESGYFGHDLTILDIGANVGSFSMWANLRWPHSTIHAYEPNPETFPTLVGNVAGLPNVACHNLAIYPSDSARQLLFSRHAGDGEAGLVAYIGSTFEYLDEERIVPVQVLHPRDLPRCDVLKIDVEGGEASILENMDLADVSLILLEYQDMRNRLSIERLLQGRFVCEFEDRHAWDRILPASGYRRELAGDFYGHLFFVNRRRNRLHRTFGDEPMRRGARPVLPGSMSLRQLLLALPGAARRALASRLPGLFRPWTSGRRRGDPL